jgi:hypothetical protein
MDIGPVLGIIGDGLSVFAGLMLAADARSSEKDFDDIKNIAKAAGSPGLAKLKLEHNGVVITDESDARRAFLRRSRSNAVAGCIVLTFGFAFLLGARIAEFLK